MSLARTPETEIPVTGLTLAKRWDVQNPDPVRISTSLFSTRVFLRAGIANPQTPSDLSAVVRAKHDHPGYELELTLSREEALLLGKQLLLLGAEE